MKSKRTHILLLLSLLGALLISAIEPHDYFTWFLEVAPAIVGVSALTVLYNGFRFTTFVLVLIWFHCVILFVGGHYTYAEMPLFNWLRDSLNLERNYYDRLGHFAQGFVPAMIAREILLRNAVIRRGGWLSLFVVCICLSISVSYEWVEWWVAVMSGDNATAFLGTQGDVWDTQWDMFMAGVGAVTSLVLLSGYHDKALKKLLDEPGTDKKSQ